MRHPINYSLLSQALDYYKKAGVTYIEVPWLVDQEYDEATAPDKDKRRNEVHSFSELDSWKDLEGRLVASSEQSFVQMMVAGRLEPNKNYMTASPCFRFRDNEDPLHFPTFMKIELFAFGVEDPRDRAMFFCTLAGHCFLHLGIGFTSTHRMEGDSWDLYNRSSIELGSYGFREKTMEGEDWTWVYGTGLAEPRFSQAMESQKNE